MHIKHCLSSAKAIPIQEAQNCIVLMQLHLMLKIFVGDAWLAPWILLRTFDPNSLKRLRKTCRICHTSFSKSFNRRKRILYSCYRNLLQIGNVVQELSLLVNKLTILSRKIIQRSIFFKSDLFSSSGFLHLWSVHVFKWQWRHGKWNTSSTEIKEICWEINRRYQWV